MNILNKVFTLLLYIFIFSAPLFSESFKLEFHGVSAVDMLLGIIILIYLINILVCRDSWGRFIKGIRDFFKDSLCVFMLLLFIVMSISVLYAKEKGLAISETARFAAYLILFFIIKYEINSEEVKENMLKTYIGICSVLSIMGIIQYVTNLGESKRFINSYDFGASSRITVTLTNPNNYGAFLILAVFPVIMLAINEKNKKKKLYYSILSLLLLINIILTFSRNAYLGFVLGCFVLVLIYSYKLIFLMGGLGAVSLLIPQIRGRFAGILDPMQNKSRFMLWKTALYMIKDHPLLGVGNGNFVSNYDEYVFIKHRDLIYKDWKRYPSHNSYLKMESELGVLGIVSFIGMLTIAWFKVRAMIEGTENSFIKTFYTGFLVSMISFYFMNFFDNLFFVPRTTVYFYILLAVSQSFLYNNKSKETWRLS